MIAIVGLGNPGAKYSKTRHNIGFRIVDTFVDRRCGKSKVQTSAAFHMVKTTYNGAPIAVIKPQLYMNLSGEALRKVPLNFRGGDEMFVVYDDAALAVGALRIRAHGSAGGQKGLKNIIDVFQTDAIPRLRVGIGKNSGMPLEDYVLRPFDKEQLELMPEIAGRAVDAIACYLDHGVETAMQQFNHTPKAGKEDPASDGA
jgi:PTH1 family peptidyl-tRNA hydrolase